MNDSVSEQKKLTIEHVQDILAANKDGLFVYFYPRGDEDTAAQLRQLIHRNHIQVSTVILVPADTCKPDCCEIIHIPNSDAGREILVKLLEDHLTEFSDDEPQ